MNLISIKDASLSFSDLEILKNTSFYINNNERVCLTGKNGAGKSTLLKIINKKQHLDQGLVVYRNNIQISYLKQENLDHLNISIFEFIKKKFTKINIHEMLKIEKIIEILKLNKNTLLSEVSGGFLRKIALAAALVNNPDILLLDEPTNHLDISTITWLENFLKKFSGSIIFISHDRSFIDNISTRIVNLDRGKLISFPGNYTKFIMLKNKNDHIEKVNKKLFDQKLEKEEIWIKKGIKARTTRNEGRVKNLEILRKTNENYKKVENFNNIQINEITDYSGKIVFKLKNINFCIKNKTIIHDFSSIIQYGDKIGLIGDNGSGKSTMIKILIGENKIQKGNFYSGKKIKIAYFDQNRLTLDSQKSILDNINEGKDKVLINNKEQHLIGYLKKFLFKPNELQRLVKTLSGGECNRLLLAKLFLKKNNVLIFDEPTNDLDLDTLKLLEKIIIQYSGTVLIVSHDRYFIRNVVNKYWLFKGNGLITTHLGVYDHSIEKEIKKNKTKKNTHILNKDKKLKLLNTNQLKNKLKNILNQIDYIEKNIKILQEQINKPEFFKQDIINQLPILKELNLEEKKLEIKLKYWENLEKNINENFND
ncbi:ATP-binding cassette domain-containing protein [Buchnera aphidicola (Aphis helianthi)]|uniref:ATP-binding cassette domain-containing protein n=1 Tax=Buchnera aphidicola (Aphis helianthi) TaxID=2315802 RepID=A0A4D6XU47_9GAMM|nr:ATP-binding cassette domain-containing protein [Buchnera aphidicola]QCI17181.1 ATP-binding cassette domain-containing protein [Buchnera aphidicola (Aphis helianthi)]